MLFLTASIVNQCIIPKQAKPLEKKSTTFLAFGGTKVACSLKKLTVPHIGRIYYSFF